MPCYESEGEREAYRVLFKKEITEHIARKLGVESV
jgi:hypothetical protein